MKKKSVKLLKELYNESLICEMPYKMTEQEIRVYLKGLENFENDETNHILAESFINGTIGKLIETFNYYEELNIYEYEELNAYNETLLIYVLIQKVKGMIVGFTKLLKITDNKNIVYFSTYGLWQNKIFARGLIFNFFTKWLLPKYKIIISDEGTTNLGENFWLKLIKYGLSNNKECGIYRINEKQGQEQFIRLYKIEDFSDAWKDTWKDEAQHKRIYIKE